MTPRTLYSVEREILCEHDRFGPNHNVMDGATVVAVCCPPSEVSVGSLADIISVAEAVDFIRDNLVNLSIEAQAACSADLIVVAAALTPQGDTERTQ